MVPGRPGIAFVDFANETQARRASHSLRMPLAFALPPCLALLLHLCSFCLPLAGSEACCFLGFCLFAPWPLAVWAVGSCLGAARSCPPSRPPEERRGPRELHWHPQTTVFPHPKPHLPLPQPAACNQALTLRPLKSEAHLVSHAPLPLSSCACAGGRGAGGAAGLQDHAPERHAHHLRQAVRGAAASPTPSSEKLCGFSCAEQ